MRKKNYASQLGVGMLQFLVLAAMTWFLVVVFLHLLFP
jgi:hypothetical protein